MPPPPRTGFAHQNCYLKETNDCSETISAEHYVSANILRQLGGDAVALSGVPWQKPGEVKSYAINNVTANILCKRHNEALSVLDEEAGSFFAKLKTALETLEMPPSRKHHSVHLVSGQGLELWMLKVACGMYFAKVASMEGKRLVDTHSIKMEKVHAAMFEGKWDQRAGLYFNGNVGTMVQTQWGLPISPLSDEKDMRYCGIRIKLWGVELDLVFDTDTANPGPWNIIHRPSELIFQKGGREQALILTWPVGTPERSIQFSTERPAGY